jgi:hypothetical protein
VAYFQVAMYSFTVNLSKWSFFQTICHRKLRWLVINEFKNKRKEAVVTCLSLCPTICLEGLRETSTDEFLEYNEILGCILVSVVETVGSVTGDGGRNMNLCLSGLPPTLTPTSTSQIPPTPQTPASTLKALH